eukprot:SAG22_NODE_813_length_7051_cov_71.816887_5_plen_301_part_00
MAAGGDSAAAGAAAVDHEHLLSAADIRHFHERGFAGPFELMPPAEMAALRPRLERLVAEPCPVDGRLHVGHNAHQYDRLLWDLCRRRGVAGRLAQLGGDDLLLWRTNFFIKDPETEGGTEIPYHQDFAYWPLEPSTIVSAWIAITDSTQENGCLSVLPGTHASSVPHIPVPEGARMEFPKMADPSALDLSSRLELPMRAGQVLLFNERTVHQSAVNTSAARRIGLAVRAIPPQVKVGQWDTDWHQLVQLTGRDRLGLNRTQGPPPPLLLTPRPPPQSLTTPPPPPAAADGRRAASSASRL